MRIGVVAPTAVRIPTTGYGGIERACGWLADEFTRRGHEVLLFGNVDEARSPSGWTGVPLSGESDILSPDHFKTLVSCDAVSDWTHGKFARFAKHPNYRATVMWTDVRDEARRNIYPSQAVRDAFKDPGGTVVPIGLPVEHIGTTDRPTGPYVSLGRIAHYKGQDLSVRIAQKMGVPLTVAGHAGAFADAYFALRIAKECRAAGFAYVPDPPDLEALLDGAAGLIHAHRWVESFSIVAAQALLRGIPILTTDVGAPQEFVRRFDGGMIVPLKELEAGRWEAAGVRDFFDTNWNGRRQGIAKRARELFDVRNVAERYLDLFGGK